MNPFAEAPSGRLRKRQIIRLFLCGDVMTGRGIDQVLPHPCDPHLHEDYVRSATEYVRFAERVNGPIPRAADPAYVWGAALDEWARTAPDARIINLETNITHSEDRAPKAINYRMSPENAAYFRAASIDCSVLANNHILDWGRAADIHPKSKNLAALELVPLQIRRFQLARPSGHDVQWLREKLGKESGKFETRVELTSRDTLAVSWPPKSSSPALAARPAG